ncbi:origin recognition complex subunit 2-domain-containing protein [Schizothecium vesticola]|uniref:Origin recognition complex subunit 2 n=1 Tax=Schizothecium vesticola TaxID=314040 RepID=A0AA40F788_9PEZI|nr:origin recognition complex subunit 2-domain-containing protein [Schizothecium vesticola]
MARRKAAAPDKKEPVAPSPKKRQLPVDPYEVPDDSHTPKRRRQTITTSVAPDDGDGDDREPTDDDPVQSAAETSPTKKRQARPAKDSAQVTTPSALRRKAVVATPVKLNGINGTGTPSRNIADRSARRKSARALIDRVVGGAISDDEGEEGDIAREIYDHDDTETVTDPPRDLPPHEQYFFQNKPGLTKTSANNLSSLEFLTHDEYFSLLRQLPDPHAKDVDFLQSLHAEFFPQWHFELTQGFSACLYGYGSKRLLLHHFATYLSSRPPSSSKIVIINGYVRTLSLRDILSTISTAVDPTHRIPVGPPVAMAQALLSSLTAPLTLLINSIDAPPLRKPGAQAILAQLAAHPRVRLVCSADTPDFAFLWDSALRSAFNFVFHDCTTFAPLTAELDVVDDVHELLGRKARRVGGKEGVAFVLRSLPENAKSLFRLLVSEVLVVADDVDGGAEGPAVEYRMVYNKAVEEFICSSEMAFRTLLKEFHDHQIITSHKDALGTELLSLPFRKDELEGILEDLMS